MSAIVTQKSPSIGHSSLPGTILVPDCSQSEQNAAVVYLASLGSPASRKMAASRLNCIARFFGYHDAIQCKWELMRYEHVIKFIDHLKNTSGKSSRHQTNDSSLRLCTINAYLVTIKAVLKTAWSLGQMRDGDLLRIRSVKSVRGVEEPGGRALTFRETRAILKACDGNAPRDLRDRAILSLLIGNGLRRAEITRIQLSDINQEDQSIRILGKGRKERKIVLIAEVWEALMDWISVRETLEKRNQFGQTNGNGDYVFCRFTNRDKAIVPGNSLVPYSVANIIEKRMEIAGKSVPSLEDVKCHDFRRTFATRLFEKNVDAIVIRDLMGHANIATTARYDKRGESAMRRAMEKVEL